MEQLEAVIADVAEATSSRLTIILHPNHSRIDIALNDRKFNSERYTHSRDKDAEGAEKALLDTLNEIIGVERATAGKNILALDTSDGMRLCEFMPRIVAAITEWGATDSYYKPAIYVENRRWEIAPTEDDWGISMRGGQRETPGEVDIGLPYRVWDQRAEDTKASS